MCMQICMFQYVWQQNISATVSKMVGNFYFIVSGLRCIGHTQCMKRCGSDFILGNWLSLW